MKRFLAIVALFILCVGPVTADYLFIKVDLSKVNFSANGAGTQAGGAQGFQPSTDTGGARQPAGYVQPMGSGFGAAQPMGMLPGQTGDTAGGVVGPDYGTHIIMAVIELKSKAKMLQQGPPPGAIGVQGAGDTTGATGGQGQPQPPAVWEVDHKFGFKGRFPVVPIVEYRLVSGESVIRQFPKRYGKDMQEAKDPGRLYQAASWALSHGLMTEFRNAMALLAKVDAKHYAVKNYIQLLADLKKAPANDDAATQAVINLLKGEGFHLQTSAAGHYGILTKHIEPQFQGSLKRRLARCEESLENFYYWFALQENVPMPTVPSQRLYVLLVDDKQAFHDLHVSWGGQPMAADAFTPRRDNLVVLSSKRLDENFTTFEKNNAELMARSTLSREELINGDIWKRAENKGRILQVAAFQTLAIMQKAMEDEAERASITHEAARQLLFASGTLSRNVNVPEWLQSGLASYFDTPYGALYGGVGLPSWSHLVSLKHYRKQDKLGGSKQETLMRTLTDRFFREALRTEQDLRDDGEKKDKQDEKVKEQQEVAQSTAWALTYFLLEKKKLPQLMQYAQELNNLPRDLALDERALQMCFGRAFNMADPKDARRLDPRKTKEFADEWFEFMSQQNLEIAEVETILSQYRYPPQRRAAAGLNQPGTTVQPGLQVPRN